MLYNWFENIEFKYPWALLLLVLVPLIAFLHFRLLGRRKASMMVTTSDAFKVRTFRNSTMHLPFWFRLLAITCIIVAIARPQRSDIRNRTKGEGIDIVLCMDISGSMLSPDFTPNRLEVAKQMAAEFVRARPVDQIGLVIFSGESFTQFPLSTDHQTLLQHITNIKSGLLQDGTVIGEGLAKSVDRLSLSKSKSKVIILLTDGKEEAPDTRLLDPYTALEIAKTKGVKVYTIGMGAETVIDAMTGQRVSGSKFLDEDLMRRIAAQTGGQYFRAKDETSLQSIYAHIDRLEKSEVEIVSKTRYEEQFVYLVLAALFFLGLELILKYTLLRTFP
jgi:Ca-activated chloride channel family protein